VDLLQSDQPGIIGPAIFYKGGMMNYWGKTERKETGGAFGGSKPGSKKMVRKRRVTEERTATVAMSGTVGVKLFKQLHRRNIIEQLKKQRFDKRRGYVSEAPK
jgi:hypothetical protein